jgi:hypothetical protein
MESKMTDEVSQPAVAVRLQRPVGPLVGGDSLREWLTNQGFRIAHDGLARDGNCCNWYAYRPTKHKARECECNDGKPMQIVIRPWRIEHADAPGGAWESVEVDVTGEAGSHWYKLQCYSLKPDELMGRLHEIEAALIAAWNALRPNLNSTTPPVR